ncbi:MAG: MFS transporter [Caldilineales bacterium]|nr:MFS transporter [Caldilineales bacterium]MDW8317330.1 MFS transporter [Anaerolineae bacterium]
MTTEPTTVEKLRGLPWSIASNAVLAVFLQLTFFGSLFVLFLNELGLSKGQIGVILSLLPFTGLLAIPAAPTLARMGYKRASILFFAARSATAAAVLLTPWVALNLGSQAALAYVGAVVLVFSVFRILAVTASFPWTQEYVPNAVRGKYTAVNNLYSTATGFLAVALSSWVLARTEGLAGFMLLIAIGVAAGLVSAALLVKVPGGAPPAPDEEQPAAERRALGVALRDRDFMRYLTGVALYTLATVPIATFLPLFMQEQVGLTASQTVQLQNGALVGGLLSSYLWGWFSDRYGSKPVMLTGVLLRAALVLGWMFMPRQSPLSLVVALAIAVVQGLADVGWQVGSARLLYVSAVPPDKRGDYMALYWAWFGLAGGFSQLFGGWLLERSAGLRGEVLGVSLDPYLPLLLVSLVLPLVTFAVMRQVRDDSRVGVGEFAGIFLRGNPVLAMEAVVRFHRARDEDTAVRVTERLGRSKSPLTEEELLEALEDPRFNVRFEAVIAVAHLRPDQRLIEALAEVLDGPEPALSTLAAWALGRTGDSRAIEPLRRGLSSKYRSVQAHCIRSLGVLGDREIVPLLMEKLATETDVGMQLAYASALGRMQVEEATPRLLEVLYTSPSRSSRREMALSVARVLGDEHHFIQLFRDTCRERDAHAEPGTALAQEVFQLQKRFEKGHALAEETDQAMTRCAQTFARQEVAEGVAALAALAATLPLDALSPPARLVLEEAARRMEEFGVRRLEYTLLALHALHTGWRG